MSGVEGGAMSSNYDGQGKTLEEETHGAMVTAVAAVVSLVAWGVIGYAAWRFFF